MNKILICEFTGYGEKAIVRALRRMDYDVIEFYHHTDNYDIDKSFLLDLKSNIEKEQPDIVFSLNYLPIVSKLCNVYKIIYISWIYDSPEMHLYSRSISNSVNRIFIFDKLQYERFHERSPHTVFYLPLATEPMSMEDMQKITEEEYEKYGKDITFVGSLYNESDKRFHDLFELPEYWQGYIEGIMNAQLQVFGYNFIKDALSDDAVKELRKLLHYSLIDDYQGMDDEIIADHFLGKYCSALDRKRTITAIAKYHRLAIYTSSDTSDIEKELKGYGNGGLDKMGYADPITMTPKIFHCSGINLNITSKTIQSGIPLRVFDVLGSGGFLITNYQQELYDWFTPGEDLIVYEDLEDLNNKIDYYLSHEDERRAIAEHGYRTVCDNYTYDRMLRIMIDEIEDRR